MMTKRMLAMVLVVLWMLGPAAASQAADVPATDIVRDGRIVNAAYGGDVWGHQGRYLQGQGQNNPLWSGVWWGEGDFHIIACLTTDGLITDGVVGRTPPTFRRMGQ